jgi:hypothetical protein
MNSVNSCAGLGVGLREQTDGLRYQLAQRQRQVLFDQHAHHAQRVAAQRERVLVAGGQLADAEQARQGLELVGQGHHHPGLAARQASPAKRGL